MVDKLEKLGRLVLWLTLASGCMLVVLGLARWQSEAAAASASLRAATEREQKRLEKEAAKPQVPAGHRLSLKSMGRVMRALDISGAQGAVWFTNVSQRSGVVCVVGVASNETTHQASESLPACTAVSAYEAVNMKMMFAGGELRSVCKGVECEFRIKDEPDAQQ